MGCVRMMECLLEPGRQQAPMILAARNPILDLNVTTDDIAGPFDPSLLPEHCKKVRRLLQDSPGEDDGECLCP